MKVDDVHHHLHMALGLHVSAHNPEGTDRNVSLHQESWNDRMVAPLTGLQAIHCRWIEREISPTVLHRNASTVNDNSGAEPHVVGLDIGNHISLSVGTAEINGAALRWEDFGIDPGFVPDLRCPIGTVCRIQIGMIVERHMGRVCDGSKGIGKCHFDSFQLAMEGQSRVPLRKVKLLQDIQGHQCHNSLSVGRDLTHIVTAIRDMYGFHPLRLISREVLISQITPETSALFIHSAGKITGIKGLSTRFPYRPKRCRMIRKSDHFPRQRGTVFTCKGFEPRCKFRSFECFAIAFKAELPYSGQIRCTRISVFRIGDGRCKIFR